MAIGGKLGQRTQLRASWPRKSPADNLSHRTAIAGIPVCGKPRP